MRTSPYSNALGAQPGVQVKTDQADAFELSAVADQIVAMGSRASRGPIDRAFLVTRADADSRLGPVRSNLVRPEHEARMQVSEALDAGAAGVVVSRIVPASSSKRYAAIKLRDNATVVGVQALLVDAGAISESDVAVFFVWMSSSSGASGLPFVISGVSPGDYSTVQFTGGVTQSQGLLTVPAGVSDFIVTIQLVEDQLLEGVEVMTISVGGVDSFGSIGIYDTSIPPPPLPIQYGAQLWLDASDPAAISYNAGTGVINSWTDKSGNGRHATPKAGWSAGPSYYTVTRFTSGAVFLGRGAFSLSGPSLPATGNQSYFVVLYIAAYSGTTEVLRLLGQVHTQISLTSGSTPNQMRVSALHPPNNSQSIFTDNIGIDALDPIAPSSKQILSFVSPGSFQNATFRVKDAVQPKSGEASVPSAGQVYSEIGGNSSSPWRDFHIAEMVYFNKTLTDDEVAAMNQYLAAKHGL